RLLVDSGAKRPAVPDVIFRLADGDAFDAHGASERGTRQLPGDRIKWVQRGSIRRGRPSWREVRRGPRRPAAPPRAGGARGGARAGGGGGRGGAGSIWAPPPGPEGSNKRGLVERRLPSSRDSLPAMNSSRSD